MPQYRHLVQQRQIDCAGGQYRTVLVQQLQQHDFRRLFPAHPLEHGPHITAGRLDQVCNHQTAVDSGGSDVLCRQQRGLMQK